MQIEARRKKSLSLCVITQMCMFVHVLSYFPLLGITVNKQSIFGRADLVTRTLHNALSHTHTHIICTYTVRKFFGHKYHTDRVNETHKLQQTTMASEQARIAIQQFSDESKALANRVRKMHNITIIFRRIQYN